MIFLPWFDIRGAVSSCPTVLTALQYSVMADCEHLLIDGYNLVHALPESREALPFGIDAARQKLASSVRLIHDFEGIRTTIVFDGKGDDISIERPSGQLTFSYLYSPAAMTADAVIEQLVRASPTPQRITVASDDNMVRQSTSASGALTMGAGQLNDWIRSCQIRQGEMLKRRNEEVTKKWRRKIRNRN